MRPSIEVMRRVVDLENLSSKDPPIRGKSLLVQPRLIGRMVSGILLRPLSWLLVDTSGKTPAE